MRGTRGKLLQACCLEHLARPAPDTQAYAHCAPLLGLLPPPSRARYLALLAEHSVPAPQRFYCPACSQLLVVEAAQPDAPQACPACRTRLCAWCRVPWHAGASCGEHQVRGRAELDGFACSGTGGVDGSLDCLRHVMLAPVAAPQLFHGQPRLQALAALQEGPGSGAPGSELLVLARHLNWKLCPGCRWRPLGRRWNAVGLPPAVHCSACSHVRAQCSPVPLHAPSLACLQPHD